MTMKCALSLAVLFPYSGMFAQEAGLSHGLFGRRYQEGERLVYRMKASNNGQRYEAQATGVVMSRRTPVEPSLKNTSGPTSLPTGSRSMFLQRVRSSARGFPWNPEKHRRSRTSPASIESS